MFDQMNFKKIIEKKFIGWKKIYFQLKNYFSAFFKFFESLLNFIQRGLIANLFKGNILLLSSIEPAA